MREAAGPPRRRRPARRTLLRPRRPRPFRPHDVPRRQAKSRPRSPASATKPLSIPFAVAALGASAQPALAGGGGGDVTTWSRPDGHGMSFTTAWTAGTVLRDDDLRRLLVPCVAVDHCVVTVDSHIRTEEA